MKLLGGAFNLARSAVQQVFLVVRPTQMDSLATPAARSSERYRRVAYSAGAGGVARLVGVGVTLLTVPLTLHYLGPERYGMWLTMSSFVALLSFTDLGIGNGLLTAVTEAASKSDRGAARAYVSSALVALVATASAIALAFALLYPRLPWERLFGVETGLAAAEAGPAVAVLVLALAIGLPLGVVSRCRFALQEGFVDSAWTVVGSLIGLGALLVAIRSRAGLPWLVAAMSLSPLVASAANGILLFVRDHPHLRPRLGAVTRAALRRILGAGGYFFIIQLSAVLAFQTDTIVVAQVLGAEAVPQYAVPMRLFALIQMLLTLMLVPLWPAYGDALGRGDQDWAGSALKRSFVTSVGIALPLSLLLLALGPWLIALWVGPVVAPSYLLLVGLAALAVISATEEVTTPFLNAAGVLRPQAILAVLMMVSNLGLSIWLTTRLGVAGVVYGSLVAEVLFVVGPSWYLVRRRLRQRPGR
jgi:O-antigen/teichoic acid export membrane protein